MRCVCARAHQLIKCQPSCQDARSVLSMDQRSSVYHIQPIGARHTDVKLLAFGSFIHVTSAGILEQSMKARNRVGIGLSYRPARLHRPGGIDPLESIPGLQSFKIPALNSPYLILHRHMKYSFFFGGGGGVGLNKHFVFYIFT